MARKFYKPEGQWNSAADVTVANFEESGHPVFRASSALDLGFQKGGRCTIHFSADPSNADFLFRAINPANQLSIHGAVADLCDSWSIILKHREIPSRK